MSGEWPLVTLGSLLKEVIDRRGVTPTKLGGNFILNGHRVVSAKLVKENRFDFSADEPRFVSNDIYRRWMRSP